MVEFEQKNKDLKKELNDYNDSNDDNWKKIEKEFTLNVNKMAKDIEVYFIDLK